MELDNLKEEIDKKIGQIFSDFISEQELTRNEEKLVGPYEILRKSRMINMFLCRYESLLKNDVNNDEAQYIQLKISEKMKEIIDYY